MITGFISFAGEALVKETFGGPAAQIYVYDDFSARIEFECATGMVQAGRWPTGQSRIAASGLYIPITLRREEKATFKANIDVRTGKMALAVKVGNKRAMNYKLIRGQSTEMKRCR